MITKRDLLKDALRRINTCTKPQSMQTLAEEAVAAIDELESMLQSRSAMLDEIACAAGYRAGEQYSAAGIVARLRDGDR